MINRYVTGDWYGGCRSKVSKPKPPHGATPLEEPKPPTYQYSYSNPASQGALICETRGFPGWYFRDRESIGCAYSDRIAGWDHDRFSQACKLAGGGDQAWAYRLPSLSDDALKEFAMVALNLPCLPTHVRVVHYYNVSSGYSCPVVEAIYPKQEDQPPLSEG